MVGVLMVAEKPSICTAIAKALSNGHMESRGHTPPVYEFQAEFQGRRADIRVTSVVGHVFSTDFPKQYQSWDAVEPVELFSAPVLRVPEKKGIVAHLAREAKGMDYLVLWLDCDREGENICFEVIECVQSSMRRVQGQQIFRAKFSAITPKDIHAAMRTLGEPNENESLAVEARQELDLKVGVAFSRFQTRYFQGKYGDLDSSLISYGPCQTPTLGFCVDRHDEIQSFTPEPFWSLQVRVEKDGTNVELDWSRGRLFDQECTVAFQRMVEEEPVLRVLSVKESETKRARPTPLNTVELLKLASKTLGMGPHEAMGAAERLYLSGYLSYPRTESTAYPDSFDINDALRMQSGSRVWGDYAGRLLQHGYTRPKSGVDMGDHPPITPVRPLDESLGGGADRLYDLVATHFLASVSPDAVFLSTKIVLENPSGEEFTATGRRMIKPGFLEIMQQPSDEQNVPRFVQGEVLPIASVRLREGQTSAPGYLTEAELIGLMEKHGIGTDASIATHINNICVRNYVQIAAGRTLVPTSLGIVLVHGYYRIDPDLVLPNVRATIEKQCTLIAQGKAGKLQVVEHSLNNFEQKFRYFLRRIEAMDALFEATFSPLAATGKFMSRCGKCNRFMRYIPLKPQRLFCPTCNHTYNLPQNGTIKLYMEQKCPLDSFELLLFSLGNSADQQGKAFTLCPYCYNYPPDFERINAQLEGAEEVKGDEGGEVKVEGGSEEAKATSGAEVARSGEHHLVNMGCNQCMHPTCKYSAYRLGVCPCPMTPELKAQVREQTQGSRRENTRGRGRGGARGRGRGRGRGGHEREITDPAAEAKEQKEQKEEEEDNEGCPGTLVLDITSKPHWKLACNICHAILRIRGEIANLTPAPHNASCDECDTTLLKFEFKEGKSPLASGASQHTGCISCDDELNALTQLIIGRTMHIKLVRARRAGRGRGRRGRGRRRGGVKGDLKMSFADF